MDHGEKERAIANSIKDIVKQTSRRKASSQLSKKPRPIVTIAPKSLNDPVESSSSSSESNRPQGPNPPSDHGSSQQDDGVNMLQDGSADSLSPERHDHHPMTGAIFSVSADESILLMHFLDNVFPLQYPMYKPGTLDGGRGWLLTLLLRTKPLYHATLAVSAYYRRMTILAENHQSSPVAGLIEQEKHLGICLTEFQRILKSVDQSVRKGYCPSNGLGITALVVQLIFFELFTGRGNAWQIHLCAGVNMYHVAHETKLASLTLAEKSRVILCDELPLSEDVPLVAEEVAAFRFLNGTIIWIDIISSITVGRAPQLLPYHLLVISSDSQTKLEDIMGCKNWVMRQIGRISALQERKTQALQQGHFAYAEIEQTVADINREIQCALTQGSLEGFSFSERDSATILSWTSDPTTIVTYIFAYMASIYLHLVTHDYQKLQVLDTSISGAMRVLKTQVPTQLLPTLVSPLYVIGSVARQEDEQFFRNIFSSPPVLDPLLQHRARILPILEEIWRRRRGTPSFTWKDALELSPDLLLL
ncbi:fungal-specific transcription factor domain-containing protein [Lipomyces kononenkoae]